MHLFPPAVLSGVQQHLCILLEMLLCLFSPSRHTFPLGCAQWQCRGAGKPGLVTWGLSNSWGTGTCQEALNRGKCLTNLNSLKTSDSAQNLPTMKMQPSDTTDHRLPSSTRCLTHQGRSTGLEVKREEKEEKKYQAYWLCRAFSSMIFKEKYIYVEIKYGIYLQKKRKEKTQNPKKISLIFIFRKYIFHFFLFPWYKNVKYLTMICRKQIHGILSLLWSVSTEKGLVHGVDLLWFHTHAHVRILATSPPDTTKQTRHWAKTWNAALPGKTEINFSLVHPTMRNSHHRGKKTKNL